MGRRLRECRRIRVHTRSKHYHLPSGIRRSLAPRYIIVSEPQMRARPPSPRSARMLIASSVAHIRFSSNKPLTTISSVSGVAPSPFQHRFLLSRSLPDNFGANHAQKTKQSYEVQGTSKRPFPGFVNSVPAVAYHFCLNLPEAFSQPGNGLLEVPFKYKPNHFGAKKCHHQRGARC